MSNRKGATVKPALVCPTKTQRPASGTKKEFSDEELLASLVASLTDAVNAAKRICDKPSSGVASFRRTRALIASITDVISEDPVDKQLNLEGHTNSIDCVMKDLLNSCRYDWHDGWEEQAEYMNEICEEIADWLHDIWSILETGEDLRDVRECIEYCAGTVEEISNTHSRYVNHKLFPWCSLTQAVQC